MAAANLWQPGRARLALVLTSSLLLSASFAPIGQFYLAWIGLVPWLLAIRWTSSWRSAFLWGTLGGVAFFGGNLWWLWTATIPGAVALVLYLALYWGLAAALVRTLQLLGKQRSGLDFDCPRSLPALLLVPAIWISCEWLRAHALPGQFCWLFLGYSQTPVPVLCSVADALGPYGVSYWVILANTLAALALVRKDRAPALARPAVGIGGAMLVVVAYGLLRDARATDQQGPRVTIVQSNHRHQRGGAPTVSRDAAIAFHIEATRDALKAGPCDLVVWSEGVLPPLNPEARSELRNEFGRAIERMHLQLSELAAQTRSSLLVGGFYAGGWKSVERSRVAGDIRSSVYLYDARGRQSEIRYDKIQLVPFSEYLPMRSSPSWLRRVLLWLAAEAAAQPLTPGNEGPMSCFPLGPFATALASAPADAPPTWRFVTPICLEVIDPAMVARMLRPQHGPGKRADFLVTLGNDGWFSAQERHQHFQAAIFRCIENRVAMVRCSNTGISGFVSPGGRVLETIAPGTAGTATRPIELDRRLTLYTRYGDVFAYGCMMVTASAVAMRVARHCRAVRHRLG